MYKLWDGLKQNFWPVSALLLCPCHLPLSMAAIASLTAGTALGAYISTHYSSIETVLAVVFSFYFVLAFMIWIVRGPAPKQAGAACAIDKNGRLQVRGLSTRQIIVWGIIGMFVMPALIAISTFTKQNYFIGNLAEILTANSEVSSGFIWLISLSTVVMIPVMIIWLVWMWLAWSKRDVSNPDPEPWSYEYE
jgi:mercuric ion transport protein